MEFAFVIAVTRKGILVGEMADLLPPVFKKDDLSAGQAGKRAIPL